MPVRKVSLSKMANNSSYPKLEFSEEDYRKLDVSDYRAFLAVKIEVKMGKEKNEYSLWKLHRIYVDIDEIERGFKHYTNRKIIKWIWIGMWGSSVWQSITDKSGKRQAYFDSLEEALKVATEAGWKVCQVDYSNFDTLIHNILHSHGIRKD